MIGLFKKRMKDMYDTYGKNKRYVTYIYMMDLLKKNDRYGKNKR